MSNFTEKHNKIATHLQNHLKKRKNNLFLSESKKLADYNNKKLKEFFKMLNNQIKI